MENGLNMGSVQGVDQGVGQEVEAKNIIQAIIDGLGGGEKNPSAYNKRGGRGEHYSDKGGHRERSKVHQPKHEKHWNKVNKQQTSGLGGYEAVFNPELGMWVSNPNVDIEQ